MEHPNHCLYLCDLCVIMSHLSACGKTQAESTEVPSAAERPSNVPLFNQRFEPMQGTRGGVCGQEATTSRGAVVCSACRIFSPRA